MLHVVLNYPGDLPPAWHLDYGITAPRVATLLAAPAGRNSFANSYSETALTLFMLGNVDRWKQIGSFGDAPPRNLADNGWNPGFFERLRGQAAEPVAHAMEPLWTKLPIVPSFKNDELDFSKFRFRTSERRPLIK